MTKFIGVLTALMLTMQSVVFADYQLSTSSDELIVSGVGAPYSTAVFMLLDSDNLGFDNAEDTLEAYYEKINSDADISTQNVFFFKNLLTGSDGSWEYVVPMTGIETKNLTLVSTTGNAEFIQYASVGFRTSMLPVINSAACEADDGTKLSDKITYYISYISDKPDFYKSKISNKKRVAQLTKNLISQLDIEDENALAFVKKWIDEAMIVCAVNEGIISDFDEALTIVEYNSKLKTTMLSDGKDKTVNLLKKGTYASVDEYCKAAQLHLSLQNFNYNINRSADSLLDVLEKNNTVLKLDLSGLYSLDKADQPKAAKKLAEKYSESIEDAKRNLNEIVEDMKPQENSGTGGGIGIGSSTSINESKVHGASVSESITDEYLLQQKYIYSDLADASWAVDAVFHLSDEGIINGYEDGTFKPLNLITRAEFVKLVVSAFYPNEQIEFSANFCDVDKNSWYAKYVNVAYNMGIVSGDEKGCFNPDEAVSRQDMAVIIYNAGLKFNLFETNAEFEKFSDDGSISDYAKQAVYTLKSKSVISGIGGGVFDPLANANRASASQILYNLILNTSR